MQATSEEQSPLLFPPIFIPFLTSVCVFAAVHSFPLRSEGSDQADPHSSDGYSPDARAWKRSWNAAGPPVQPGPVLRQHPWAEADLVGQHGQSAPQKWRFVRGMTRKTVSDSDVCVYPFLVIFFVLLQSCG